MKYPVRLLGALLAFALRVSAEPLPIFPEIRFAGGKVLKQVEFLKFAQSGAMARWEGGRGSISYESLPEEIREQVIAKRPPPPPRSEAAPRPGPQPVAKTKAPAQQPAPPTSDIPWRKITDTVERRADRHYRDGRKSGSGYSLVFDLRIDLDEPRAVPGWLGRYDVEGTAHYNYYDSIWGGSFSSSSGRFVCEVETLPSGGMKVTSFTPKL